jgi:hypothetical protein
MSAFFLWRSFMTTQRWNMPAGQASKDRVTTNAGSGISTDIVRVLVDDANATKEQVLLALNVIRQKIIESQWPL